MNPNIDSELLIIEVEPRKNLWHSGDDNYKVYRFFLYNILKLFV